MTSTMLLWAMESLARQNLSVDFINIIPRNRPDEVDMQPQRDSNDGRRAHKRLDERGKEKN
jgi:hypothetical protein